MIGLFKKSMKSLCYGKKLHLLCLRKEVLKAIQLLTINFHWAHLQHPANACGISAKKAICSGSIASKIPGLSSGRDQSWHLSLRPTWVKTTVAQQVQEKFYLPKERCALSFEEGPPLARTTFSKPLCPLKTDSRHEAEHSRTAQTSHYFIYIFLYLLVTASVF